MQTIEYKQVVDKTSWSRGEWDREPDKCQFLTEAGLPGLIVRVPSGALCGYVGLAEGHKLHGMSYDDVDVSVHGGLTFSNSCQADADETTGICHKPSEGEPEHVWWFGFDCAHSGDKLPGYQSKFFSANGRYRNWAYVKNEVESLAKQLKDLG